MRFASLFLSISMVLCVSSCTTVRECNDHGTFPFSTEHATRAFSVSMTDNRGVNPWFADGEPTVLTIHNPTDSYREIHVTCLPSVSVTYMDYGRINGSICLHPHKEQFQLVQFMNVDAMHNVCKVDRERVVTPSDCVENWH